MFEKSLELSCKRIIRIFVFAALFFVLINVVVDFSIPSFSQTKRASEVLLAQNVCNFALDDFADIQKMIKNDGKKKIILLGDSIFYGIGVYKESDSVSGYLRKIFPGYSVYNLSSCGSKPLDYYFWLNRLKDEDAIFIVQYNYKWFSTDNKKPSDRVSQKKILTEFENYIDEETYEKLGVSVSLLDKMSHFLTKSIPIAASRTKLFATILGEKSKEDFIEHMFFGTPKNKTMAYKQQYWRDKDEIKTFNCKISYKNKSWSESENFNLYMYEKTLKFVNNNNLNVVVLLPPYNSELIKKCMKDAFNKNVTWFLDKAVQNGIKSASFIENIDEKYFLDDMHLNADGNRQLAQLISKKIK